MSASFNNNGAATWNSAVATWSDTVEADVVTFSPAAGAYDDDQLITLSYADETATIYYTTDGSDPDNTDTEYTTPFTIDDFTVKAIAYDDSSPPVADCEISSATYTIATYNITYDGNGSDGGSVPLMQQIMKRMTPPLFWVIRGH